MKTSGINTPHVLSISQNYGGLTRLISISVRIHLVNILSTRKRKDEHGFTTVEDDEDVFYQRSC